MVNFWIIVSILYFFLHPDSLYPYIEGEVCFSIMSEIFLSYPDHLMHLQVIYDYNAI